MAVLFAAASSMRLSNAAAVSTSRTSLTMAAWCKPTTSTGTQTVLSLANSANNNRYHALGLVAANTGFFETSTTTLVADAFGPAGTINDGAWGHVCGIITSATSRTCYVNGVAGTVDTTNTSGGTFNPNATGIGCLMNSPIGSFWDGVVAEAAIWAVPLTAPEIASLAAAVCPLLIRPDQLLAYWPLIGRNSPEIDLVGGFNMTFTNSPTADPHCRIYIPTWPRFVKKSSGTGANVTADTGTATADGGTAALTFTISAASGTATADGGTVSRINTADTGTATATGGTAALTVTISAATGAATASGGTVSVTDALTANNGAATAGAGTVALTATVAAANGTATAGGAAGTLTVTLTATTGSATASGGTVDVSGGGGNGVVTASGGTASATGGSAAFTDQLTSATGTATAGGSIAAPTFTYVAATGTASAAGGTATFVPAFPAAGGAATATGGTVALKVTITAATGTATAGGGSVARVNPAAGGLANATGTAPVVTFTYTASGGTATAAGGTAIGAVVQTKIRWPLTPSTQWNPDDSSDRWPLTPGASSWSS